jgi:hypothetical protein
MKKYIQIGAAFLVLVTTALLAQDIAAYLQFQKVDGTPTMQAEKGTVLAAASENALWIKGGGNDALEWTKFNFVPLQGAIVVTGTLSSGTIAIVNAGVTTNSRALLQGVGTTNAGALSYAVASGTLTVSSTSGSDARVVTGVVYGP